MAKFLFELVTKERGPDDRWVVILEVNVHRVLPGPLSAFFDKLTLIEGPFGTTAMRVSSGISTGSKVLFASRVTARSNVITFPLWAGNRLALEPLMLITDMPRDTTLTFPFSNTAPGGADFTGGKGIKVIKLESMMIS